MAGLVFGGIEFNLIKLCQEAANYLLPLICHLKLLRLISYFGIFLVRLQSRAFYLNYDVIRY